MTQTPGLPPRALLARLFDAAVAAADPVAAIRAHLPARPRGRTVVVGAGKAASQMAAALEAEWDGPLEGAVVAQHGPVAETRRIAVLTAAHPLPDAAGLAAAERLMALVAGLGAEDLVIALISGGGSALLPAPAPGLTFDDELAVNRALLASGAPISAMNLLRKHVSRIKGGRLAALAHPARVVSLVISDIPGDVAAQVASGPTIPDAGDREAALRMVAQYGLALPPRVMAHLHGAAAAPRPEDPAFARDEVHVVASARVSLEAAAAAARAAGWPAVILSDAIEGEARDIGLMHAALAREIRLRNRPFAAPVILLSGGETTVTIAGGGGAAGDPSAFTRTSTGASPADDAAAGPGAPAALAGGSAVRALSVQDSQTGAPRPSSAGPAPGLQDPAPAGPGSGVHGSPNTAPGTKEPSGGPQASPHPASASSDEPISPAPIARPSPGASAPPGTPAAFIAPAATALSAASAAGRGGRNSEFLLSLALASEGLGGVTALAADTDGRDGSEQNAGAFCDAGTLERIRAAGLDPRGLLRGHDAFTAFAAAGDLFDTGPTGTNVNDFRAILIEG